MSRVGNAPITVPADVQLTISGQTVTAKGKLGELSQELSSRVTIKNEEGILSLERVNEEKQSKADHGLFRALVANMILGVSTGWQKQLELVGVGYRATNQGQNLDLSLGYSHNILFEIPAEVSIETKSEKGKNPIITLKSHDNQLLGVVASKIRSLRKPEPYKGKGVKFVGEYIRRKAGKTASK